MSGFTLRLTDQASEYSPETSIGWHLTAELPDNPHHETAGSSVLIKYPVSFPIEKHVRWYLETYPVLCPWKVENPSIIKDYIQQYAIGLFRQLSVLHGIGSSPGIDTIVVEICETGSSPYSNVHALIWEVLELKDLWKEVWDWAYPPTLRQKPKSMPIVMVRRTIPPITSLLQNSKSAFSTHSDDSDEESSMVTHGHYSSTTYDSRRQVLTEQTVDFNSSGQQVTTVLGMTLTISCFRILLVVARGIDTERDLSLPGRQTRLWHDPDPSLIYEPLLAVIEKLKKDFHIQLEVCRPGTWHALERILEEGGTGFYDMVHFDMHGGIEEDKGAGLYFISSEEQPSSPDFGTKVFVPAKDIGQLLQNFGILLVALNACESGRAEPLEGQNKVLTDGASSQNVTFEGQNQSNEEQGDLPSKPLLQINLAKVFVQSGVPSVLAASFQVSSSFVSVFYESFYTALLQPESNVCKAVSIARKSAMKEKNRKVGYGLTIELDDWIIPVLYQSHNVSLNIVPLNKKDLDKGPIPSNIETAASEPKSRRESIFRRLVTKGPSSKQKEESGVLKSGHSPTSQNINRMHGRGLELLYVETLLLSRGSRKVLLLTGKYGIGKTHFIKGLGKLWHSTKFLATEPVYIDCYAHLEWRVGDILRKIVKCITSLEYSESALETAQQALQRSRSLILIDNMTEENLEAGSNVPNEKAAFRALVKSFDKNKSIMILASRDDLSYILHRDTRRSVRSWELAERNEDPIHDFAVELLKQLRPSPNKGSSTEAHDVRLVLHLLDYNPLIITLFFKTMSVAGELSSMSEAAHTILTGAIELPLIDSETRMCTQAHKSYADLSKLDNGHQLQKLMLCLVPFSMVIPCSLNDRVFFPSIKAYIGWLVTWNELDFNPETPISKIPPGLSLESDSLLLRSHMIETAELWVSPFKILVEHLMRSKLLGFTPQDLEDGTLYAVGKDYWEYLSEEAEPSSDATGKLLVSLKYLWINPVLSHYLRTFFVCQERKPDAKPPTHGLSLSGLNCAYSSYYKLFCMSSWDEHAASMNAEPASRSEATPAVENHPSKFVFTVDTANIYGAIYASMSLHPSSLRWSLLPMRVATDLNTLTARAFTMFAYKPLAMAYFTEKHLLDMILMILAKYDAAPRAERDSITALTTAAVLSFAECTLLFTIGQSEYSDLEVDRKLLVRRTQRALKLTSKLDESKSRGRGPQSSSNRWLAGMLEDVQGEKKQASRTRRLLGEEAWNGLLVSMEENIRVAAAIKGGVLASKDKD